MDTKAFWDQRLSSHWGLQGVGYLSLGKGFNVWMYRIRRLVFKRILRTLPRKDRACDIGAGTGFYTGLLLDAGFEVTGVDLSPYAVTKLSEKFPKATFRQGNIADGLAGTYDVITALDILFHILDDAEYERAFKNIYAQLEPGGYFIFSENLPHERVSLKHQVSRSESEVLAAVSNAGFTAVLRRPMFVLMNAPTKCGRTLWWRALEYLLTRARPLGYLVGAILFPLEALLVFARSKTSTTEFVICQKPDRI